MPEGGERPSDATIEREFRQAGQALSDAETAREAGLLDAAIINRCYYACFHAVQAVLYDRGHEPTSRGGVLSLFGSAVVSTGDTTRENGRFLNQLSELRKQADYGYEEDIDVLLSRTQQLVSDMDALCSFVD